MRNPFRIGIAIGACALIAATLTMSTSAAAAQQGPGTRPGGLVEALARDLDLTPGQARQRLDDQREAQQVAAALPRSVRGQSAGWWLDTGSGDLVVAVTTETAAAAVETAGARSVNVERDRARLERLSAKVADLHTAKVSGVNGWGVNAKHATVDVQVNTGTVDSAFLRGLDGLGAGVRVVEGTTSPVQQDGTVQAGNPWWPGSESNCSVGFAATGTDGSAHFLTAGHCTNDPDQDAYGETFHNNRLGTSNVGGDHSVNAAEGDMGVVAVDEPGWELSAEVNTWGGEAVTVTGSTEPLVGQAVCHSGNTSKWQCGEVRRINQTIDYGDVVIEGLATSTACSRGGDSGGGWLAATQAVGLHSGGPAQCVTDPGPDKESIFQPVDEALDKWGLSLVTA